ncbi:hypothetical protein LBMAG53_09790 [Planctomycetota bacterium]|nr:hypothetical protein LBMAG53_09790 [Planctomycetota bacterium]
MKTMPIAAAAAEQDRQIKQSIRALRALQLSEARAVLAYEQAIEQSGFAAPMGLRQAARAHRARARALAVRIHELGGKAPQVRGMGAIVDQLRLAWTAIIGRDAVLSGLRRSEVRRVAEYRRRIPELDGESQWLVREDLLAEQVRTQNQMRDFIYVPA